MKSQQPCIGCKKWKTCFRLGAKWMSEHCKRLQAWEKRLAEYHKRVGI